MESKKENKNVIITFNEAEALVLLEWLTKINEKNNSELFEDRQAEEKVLFDLEALLEKNISETFKSNYSEILFAARRAIKNSNQS